MSKLDELLAELDKEIIDYEAVTLTQREYDLLRTALWEVEGMVMVPRAAWEYAQSRLKGLHGLRLEGEPKPIDNSKFFAAAEGK